jgi:uncharacterized membrane protein
LTLLAALAINIVVAALLVGALAWVMSRPKGLKGLHGRTVIVHNATTSLRGVLIHAHRDCFVLKHAKSLDQDADLAGEVVIPKTPGVWMQVVDPEVT